MGNQDDADGENSFEYTELQDNHFKTNPERSHDVEAVAWGGYLEVSIDGVVVIRLVDTRSSKGMELGFYVESAVLRIGGIQLDVLDGPEEEDHSVI